MKLYLMIAFLLISHILISQNRILERERFFLLKNSIFISEYAMWNLAYPSTGIGYERKISILGSTNDFYISWRNEIQVRDDTPIDFKASSTQFQSIFNLNLYSHKNNSLNSEINIILALRRFTTSF